MYRAINLIPDGVSLKGTRHTLDIEGGNVAAAGPKKGAFADVSQFHRVRQINAGHSEWRIIR